MPVQETEEAGDPDPETFIRADIDFETEADIHRTSQSISQIEVYECTRVRMYREGKDVQPVSRPSLDRVGGN
jgi:hypothetical protein